MSTPTRNFGGMRIAVDALPAFPGKSGAVGAFRSMLQIAPELDESLEMIYMVSPGQKSYYEKFLDSKYSDRVRFQVFTYPETHRSFRIMSQDILVPLYCRRAGINIHFSLNPEPVFGMPGVAEVFKVVDLQYFDVPEEFGLAKSVYRKILGRRKALRSDLVIANSHYTKQRIIECLGISDERIHIVYEAVDHQLFHQDGCSLQEQEELAKKYGITFPYLVYVSSFRPYKNHLLLLQAYDMLMREHNIPHHLVLIGNDIGNYRSVVENAANGLSPSSKGKVHFLDYVHHWDLPCIYRSASLALYPSGLETFGIPPLEAMACGTPVIVSGFTAIPEVSGGGACIVDPRDICVQADAMFRVLDNRAYRETLVNSGLTWCQRYTWRRSISETLALMAEYSS